MIAIVDYGIEKNHSLTEILLELGIDFKVTSNESEILHSDKIILPNTESISNDVKQLHLRNLFTMLRLCNKPILGISNGMHMMSSYTEDDGMACLGIFPGTAEKFSGENTGGRVSGHDTIIRIKGSKLLANTKEEEKFFFDNLLYLPLENNTSAVAGSMPIFLR